MLQNCSITCVCGNNIPCKESCEVIIDERYRCLCEECWIKEECLDNETKATIQHLFEDCWGYKGNKLAVKIVAHIL